MGLPNGHRGWCPSDNTVEKLCTNVPVKLYALFPYRNDSSFASMHIACCQIDCGERSQLLQLQCQGISERMAFLTWFIVVILIVCVTAKLESVSVFVQRGARKVALFAGSLFLAFIYLIVFTGDFNYADIRSSTEENGTHGSSLYGDIPFYPVVGAMSVAAFSYFFSSFKYSIHLANELTPAIVLLFSMFPVWTGLTVKRGKLVGGKLVGELFNPPDPEIGRILDLVIGMLALSILWVFHSILFRTVGYRADWIRAYKSVHTENPGDNYMCRLWVLGGAQGHPTWRTPAGQSIGIYLTVLSWIIALRIHSYLTKTCNEDLVLFQMMLWVPPVILTLGVMSIQLSMCKFRAPCVHEENDKGLLFQWIKHDFLSLCGTYKHMEAAVIAYRLGRDTLQAENHIGIYRYVWWDWFVAQIVFFIELAIFCISYLGIVIIRVVQKLGVCVVKLIWKRTDEFELLDMKEKNEAYRMLCERCLSEDIAEAYENSGKRNHIGGLQDGDIDLQVQEILRNHRMNISLPLLLDNISPARLSYLLHQLDIVLKENPPRLREEVLGPYNWIRRNLFRYFWIGSG